MWTIVSTGLVFSRRDRLSKKYCFNDDEKLMLETVFTYNQHPNQATLQDLADKLAVSEMKVTNWFINKRFLLKKETTNAKCLQSKYYLLGASTCVHKQEKIVFVCS